MVAAHYLLATAAVVLKNVYDGVVDVVVIAKADPPNSRAFRIRQSNHLFYDCIRNLFRKSCVPSVLTYRGRTF